MIVLTVLAPDRTALARTRVEILPLKEHAIGPDLLEELLDLRGLGRSVIFIRPLVTSDRLDQAPAADRPDQAPGKESETPLPREPRTEAPDIYDPARFDPWDRRHRTVWKKPEARASWSFKAGLGLTYDTNIFIRPLEESPSLPLPRAKGDGSASALAGAGYQTWLAEGLDSGVEAEVFLQRHFTEPAADLFSLALGAQIHDRHSWGGLILPYQYHRWWSGSDFESQSRTHSLRPQVYWRITPDFCSLAEAEWQRIHFFDGSLSANRLGLGLGHVLTFGSQERYLRLDYQLASDLADQGHGAARLMIGLAAGWPVRPDLRLDGGVTFSHYRFEDRPAPEVGQAGQGDFARRDNQLLARAALAYQLGREWRLALEYALTLNDSNVRGQTGLDPYNYRRQVLSLLASGSF